MINRGLLLKNFSLFIFSFVIASCTNEDGYDASNPYAANGRPALSANYSSRVPQQISSIEKTIIIDPSTHTWSAYDNGQLVRAGLATSGGDWCPDIGRPCRTRVGSFRIHSLGSSDCKSTIYPLPHGGAPMPFCMFFNGSQGLHGSYEVVDGNASHGCVRMEVADAEWMRFNFAQMGTRVIIKSY